LSTIVDGLTNGQSYIFRVVAINAAGAGTFSSNSDPITPATIPAIPTIQSTTIGNSQLTLAWAAPISDGGTSITDYIVQYSTDFSNWTTFNDGTSTSTSATITGLTNGTTYFLRVAAVNAIGAGQYSSLSSLAYGTPGTVPGSPTTIQATAGYSSASLTWVAPTSSGGYIITEYRIQYSINGGSSWTFLQDTAASNTSITINGLNNGTSYTFRVAAKNDIGYSSYSSSSNTVTPSTTEENITTDYCIAFIDEAHPLYVKGSGYVGALWGADVQYYNNLLDNHPSYSTIIFDVDTPFVAKGIYKDEVISTDPFYIYPTGVNSSDLVSCYLPIPEINVTGIPRPSGGIEYNGNVNAIGSISDNSFASGIVNAINTIWGENFWSQMENSYNSRYNRPCKLWIATGNTKSLGSGILSSGIQIFRNHTVSNKNWSIDQTPVYINECGERYLGWITDCILYQGDPRSCDNLLQVKNITQDNECGSNAGDRLTKFYLNNSCSGLDQKSNSAYGIGLSQTISSLFACTGIYYANLVEEFNNSNQALATWDYTEGDEENFGGCYSVHQSGDIRLIFENGVPKLETVSYCEDNCWGYGEGGGLYFPTTETRWTTFIPLNSYGIPNGTIEYEYPEYSEFYFKFYGTNYKIYPEDDPLLYDNYLYYLNNQSYQNDFDILECVLPEIRFEAFEDCSVAPLVGSVCTSADTTINTKYILQGYSYDPNI
jgi:hypothetical protein